MKKENLVKVLSHDEGYEKWSLNRQIFDIEIEFLCLNSEYVSMEAIANYLKIYQSLASEYLEAAVLKESLEHSCDATYYEFSLFCNKENFSKLIEDVVSRGCVVDIVHYNDGEYDLDEAKELLG